MTQYEHINNGLGIFFGRGELEWDELISMAGNKKDSSDNR